LYISCAKPLVSGKLSDSSNKHLAIQMKYSKTIFNKDLYDLEFTDVVNFFATTKDETLNLEFKSYVAQGEYFKKEDAVKKAVCGLLNSEGGIIIWGAPIETKDANGNSSATGALTAFSTT
jgi:hypothetical protein